MKIAIYGAGAMGTVLGAYLTKSGLSPHLVSHNVSHVSALKSGGAKISGTVSFTVPVKALLPEEMQGEYDVIFLMTKQSENEKTVKFLLPYLSLNGVICTMQNGLPEQSVAEYAGAERCLGCAVSWGATFIGSGQAALTSSPKKLTFALGSTCGSSSKINDVKLILERMGRVYVENNFIGARWAKLSINAAFSSLSALTGLTFGEVAKNRNSREIAQAVLKESFNVANASRITVGKIQGHDINRLLNYNNPLKKALSFALIPAAISSHKNLKSGMLFDLLKGKRCEIDYINGALLEYAKKSGCNAPVNSQIVELIHKIERGELSVSPQNISLIKIPQ